MKAAKSRKAQPESGVHAKAERRPPVPPAAEVPTAPVLEDVVSFHLQAIDAALGGVTQYCPPCDKASTAELLLHALCGDPRDFAHDALDDIAGELNVLSAAIDNEDTPLTNEAIKASLYRIERRAETAAQVAFRIEQAHFKADKAAKGGAAVPATKRAHVSAILAQIDRLVADFDEARVSLAPLRHPAAVKAVDALMSAIGAAREAIGDRFDADATDPISGLSGCWKVGPS